MGLFGSDSTSVVKKETTNLTDQRTYADYSDLGGGTKSTNYIEVSGEDNKLELLDYGAIDSSYDFAESLVKQMNAGQQAIVDSLASSQIKTYGLAQSAIEEAQRSESENVYINLMKWGTIAASIIAISMIFMKRGKR